MAEASRAETRASDSAAAGSHEAATARLIGKIVRKPWITSAPIQQRDAQPALLDGDPLQPLGLLEGLDVEYAAAAPFADQPFDGKFRLVGSRDGAASALLDQLADLFVERHAFDQFRGAPPVLRGDGCAPAGYSTRAANTVKMLFFIGKSLKRHAKVMKIPQKKGFGTE